MTRDGPRRRPASLLGLAAAALAALATPLQAARAQAIDCTALRTEIDAADPSESSGRYAMALRQQRDDLDRTRAYADQTGCNDGVADDADPAPCRTLARRIGTLEIGLQRLEDQAARGDPATDDRRRALREEFNAACSADPADAAAPPEAMPVDPDATAGLATRPKATSVLCVRHCDGAYYPLAVGISPDRMADMDRLCQAQCPGSESSAYAGDGADDVSGALASDGTPYSALPAAFQFRKGSTASCSCRTPHQSWADALAGAEAMLEPHKGDIVVTAALAASMARPVTVPQKAGQVPARPAASASKATSRKAAMPPPTPLLTTPPREPAVDLTREFRRSDPTL